MAEPPALAEPAASRLPPLLEKLLGRFRKSPLSTRGLWPALALAAALLAGVLWLAFAPEERTPLFRNLPDADKAAVVGALEAGGFKVGLDPRTGAVLLPPADHARARMLLAGEGLPRSAPGALDLIGEMPLGTSRAVEGAKLRMAGERELARSIESLDGIESARVLIATPDPSPFVRDRPPPKASVTVTLARGRTLSSEETRAIAHLVAGAVPGLAADAVAIADQTGRLLAGGPGSAGETALARRLELTARLEARAEESIRALLGPGFRDARGRHRTLPAGRRAAFGIGLLLHLVGTEGDRHPGRAHQHRARRPPDHRRGAPRSSRAHHQHHPEPVGHAQL